MELSKLTIVYFCINATFGSFPFFGKCIHRPVVKELNITRYSGIWYEINKYFSFADYGLSCISFRYRSPTSRTKDDGIGYMNFLRKGINKSRRRGRTSTQAGMIIFANSSSNSTRGRMETVMNSRKYRGGLDEGKREAYWVLETDYTNYSVVWSCEHAGIVNFQNVVVLGRERNPTNRVKGYAYGAMQRRGLSTKLLMSTDQEDCPELFPTNSSETRRH